MRAGAVNEARAAGVEKAAFSAERAASLVRRGLSGSPKSFAHRLPLSCPRSQFVIIRSRTTPKGLSQIA